MLEVWIDGACEPINPGGTASYGLVIKRSRLRIWEESKIVGSGKEYSNNVAEYSGLIAFLKWYHANIENNEKAIVYSDSQLLINQMMGQWRVNSGLYIPYFNLAQNMIKNCRYIDFQWISREQNQEADNLSKQALLAIGIKPRH